jgi:acetoin utilization deacetylase AcuC-like enzyme
LRKDTTVPSQDPSHPKAAPIILVVNEQHAIHHVRVRGYVETPARMDSILQGIVPTGLFERIPAQPYPDEHITAVHDPALVEYIKTVCANVAPKDSIYPYIFPVRNPAHRPDDLTLQAGYYCIDTFTPLNGSAYSAARAAVDCVLTAADRLCTGSRLAYALVRPPGHHAERCVFGGFCYFNSTAIAAHYLSRQAKVAILDVDYHHGNGQQDIFYERADVLTVSIHGHPRIAYPYFSGYADEVGAGAGAGYNVNLPLPEQTDGAQYRVALEKALGKIVQFQPDYLVVALGLDTSKGDPTGSWSLYAADFTANGQLIGALHLPTLVVQEGGYRNRVLGVNARSFFRGMLGGGIVGAFN